MATITFNGESFTVDHAVQGADYVHGYDAESNLVIAFDGVSNLSAISYDGVYVMAGNCLAEPCNDVKYCEGVLKTRAGEVIQTFDWEFIGSWTNGGSLTNLDFSQYRDLYFVYDTRSDGCTVYGGTSLLIPTTMLSETPLLLGVAYNSARSFSLAVTSTSAETDGAKYSSSDNTKYTIYCYGR